MQSLGHRRKTAEAARCAMCVGCLCQAPVRAQAAARTPDSLVRVSLHCSLHTPIEDAQMWPLCWKKKYKNAYSLLEDYVE